MVKTRKGKRRTAVKNLAPKRVRHADSRHVKGGLGKIADPTTGGGSTTGGLHDKIS